MATVTNSGEFPAKDSPTNGVFPPECEPEAEMSFGEPLHVSVTRGTSRFESIQQSLSRQATADDEEAAVGNTGSTFDLASWLMGRQRQNAPPFATRVGVAFDSLSVFGDNVKDRHIATLATPVWKLLKAAAHGFGVRNMFKKSEEEYKQLLHGMTGVVKDGEMLLVLGRPGSGCSTLLRVLGNRRKEYKHIDGSVSYGGLTPEEISKQYRGQVAYCAEDDDHYPMLTVKQTLEFAIDCKMPSRNMLEDRAGYKKEFLDALLEMYGLRSCADTVIGDSFTRGVSGGERKRVSISEQMAAGASVDIWDGSTRGLDSSTALDFVRSLRITTDVLHKATVASIYQASEDIYKLFDKVLVVDKGRQLYFGPTSEAVAYFESLGIYKPARQTSADFLTGLTQLHERRVRPEFEGRVPETAEDFERVWIESSYHNALQEQVREFSKLVERDERSDAIRAFVARTKMGDGTSGLRRKSPYGTTFGYQLGRLLRRELNIVLGNRAEHAIVVFCYVAFAALVAVSFLRISDDSNSARIRGSLIFLILAFVALSEESGVAKAMTNRRVLAKHRQLAMYHPAALSLVQSLTDIPLVIVKCTLFAVVVYFATGLARSASHFFTFDLLLAVLCACMMAFFKLLGNFAPDIDVALTVSGVVLIFWVMLSNYLQTTPQMHPYFRWISYIDPLAYTFKALMANEFRDRQILCNGASMVPSGPGFDDIAHQVCTLQGARPGQMYVHGRDYLAEGLDIYVADRWKNFGAVAGFWGLFVCLGAIVVEFVHHGATSHSINIFKRRCPKVELVTEDLVPSCSSKNSSVTADKRPSGTTFTWKYVNYTVPVKNDERQLLDSVSGYIKPGTLTALMGSSGAGKTTLLDSLSQRKTVGRLRGEMLMDGMPLPRSFRRSTGYAEQLDVHASLVTVREALRFSAYLRQPASVPDSEKNSYVERVIYLLDLTSIADCLIGDPDSGEGISLEERKRLTIGIELVSKPKILFLDEPTSGLDAQASYKVVHLLRRLAAEGQTILCTIHQPSALLFEQFDRLLLLVRGGRAVYFGELGEDAQTLLQYFERNGAPKCSPTANPAEYILDVVSNPDIDWPQLWRDSPELASILVEIDQINQDSRVVKIIDDDGDLRFARSRWHQICLVTRRMFLMYWRNLDYQLTNAALQIISAIVIGLAYLNLSDSASDLLNKTYACFLAACLNIFITNQVLPEFIRQRQYFFRENATNQYGSLAFILASVITELPFLIVTCSLFFVCFYWTAGLNSLSERIGYFYISYIVLGIYSMTLGQGIASVSTSVSMATMISPIFTTVFALFAGILIPYDLLPGIWRYTLYWLSPYQYWLDGIITNELHNSRVHCRDSELFTFEPPSGMSCGAYAGQWVEQAIGYLHNPNATTACKYCQFTVGDQYFASLNWSFDHRWRNFGILFAFIAANIAITAVTIRLYKINKR
ncbi:P-loop containing nucleoside triphosphate hydrolase protein [Coemansia mojavensis]|nr:P-loop containing nucleoside triphosphate hydrolase protein [Coemansia mojavensis]